MNPVTRRTPTITSSGRRLGIASRATIRCAIRWSTNATQKIRAITAAGPSIAPQSGDVAESSGGIHQDIAAAGLTQPPVGFATLFGDVAQHPHGAGGEQRVPHLPEAIDQTARRRHEVPGGTAVGGCIHPVEEASHPADLFI